MWSAWFERFKSAFAAVTSPQAIEYKTARQLACANERLQNNALVDHGPVQVPSLGMARRSCEAH